MLTVIPRNGQGAASIAARTRSGTQRAPGHEWVRWLDVRLPVTIEEGQSALDGAVRAEAARGLDGEAAVAAMRSTVAGTGRVATKLRAVMAETWRAMEGGR